MIIASNALVRQSGHSRTLIEMISNVKLTLAKRKAYRDTVDALSVLSDCELADLGLNRSQIADKASDCIYGTRYTA